MRKHIDRLCAVVAGLMVLVTGSPRAQQLQTPDEAPEVITVAAGVLDSLGEIQPSIDRCEHTGILGWQPWGGNCRFNGHIEKASAAPWLAAAVESVPELIRSGELEAAQVMVKGLRDAAFDARKVVLKKVGGVEESAEVFDLETIKRATRDAERLLDAAIGVQPAGPRFPAAVGAAIVSLLKSVGERELVCEGDAINDRQAWGGHCAFRAFLYKEDVEPVLAGAIETIPSLAQAGDLNAVERAIQGVHQSTLQSPRPVLSRYLGHSDATAAYAQDDLIVAVRIAEALLKTARHSSTSGK